MVLLSIVQMHTECDVSEFPIIYSVLLKVKTNYLFRFGLSLTEATTVCSYMNCIWKFLRFVQLEISTILHQQTTVQNEKLHTNLGMIWYSTRSRRLVIIPRIFLGGELV